MSNDTEAFKAEVKENIQRLTQSQDMQKMGIDFVRRSGEMKYSYNFRWMGVPIFQYPQDIIAMQELIWQLKPDTIVETGIARGGSLVFYASMLQMMGLTNSKVVGIDIDIRPHNRDTIEQHPMGKHIELIQGSSIDPATITAVQAVIGNSKTTLVCLDSMHTHDHVLEELRLYAPLVQSGSYLIAFDTCIEELPADYYPDRPWSVGNNPMTAVDAFLAEDNTFERDESIPGKLLITVARGGFLRKK